MCTGGSRSRPRSAFECARARVGIATEVLRTRPAVGGRHSGAAARAQLMRVALGPSSTLRGTARAPRWHRSPWRRSGAAHAQLRRRSGVAEAQQGRHSPGRCETLPVSFPAAQSPAAPPPPHRRSRCCGAATDASPSGARTVRYAPWAVAPGVRLLCRSCLYVLCDMCVALKGIPLWQAT